MRTLLRAALVVATATAAEGCEPGDAPPPTPDSQGAGLSIQWSSRPGTIPSEPSSDATIDRVVVHQDDLRLVGDAGSFDLDRDELEWARGITPAALPVANALPGLYSRLLFELDGDDDGGDVSYAYEITGTVKINDTFQPFTIRDRSDLNLSLDFSIMLPAGGSATIPVRIDLEKIVGAVNFSQVSKQDGRYLVEDGSSQISNVRNAVRDAFSIAGPS